MSYFDIGGHGSMVFDHARNHRYEQAINAVVTPDSVVLDLGAGLGILGLIAAKAGAKKVYLVDPSPAVLVAAEIAKANGLDNVECVQDRIETAKIAEKVDIIVSVFTGNFLLAEDLLPSLFFARDRYLKSGGTLIPDSAQMWLAPVQLGESYQSKLDRWRDNDAPMSMLQHYGLDFSPVAAYVRNQVYWERFDREQLRLLAEPQVISSLDFYSADKADCFSHNRFECRDGVCHGWLGWFSMTLGDTSLTTGPDDEVTHWAQALLPIQPQILAFGDVLSVDIHRPERGEYSWFTAGVSEQRHSTFLSVPRSAANIGKAIPAYRPTKTAKAGFVIDILQMFDKGISSAQISDYAQASYAELFASQTELDAYVEWLILRYG